MYDSSDFVFLAAQPVGLGFQRAERSGAEGRPRHAGQWGVHLDFAVENAAQLDELESQALALGARRAATQPRPDLQRRVTWFW